jgi:hypothetical protein
MGGHRSEMFFLVKILLIQALQTKPLHGQPQLKIKYPRLAKKMRKGYH